jgi:hypothetical protein
MGRAGVMVAVLASWWPWRVLSETLERTHLLIFGANDFTATSGRFVYQLTTGTRIVFEEESFQRIGKLAKLRVETIEVNRFRDVLRVRHEWLLTALEIYHQSAAMDKMVANACESIQLVYPGLLRRYLGEDLDLEPEAEVLVIKHFKQEVFCNSADVMLGDDRIEQGLNVYRTFDNVGASFRKVFWSHEGTVSECNRGGNDSTLSPDQLKPPRRTLALRGDGTVPITALKRR